MAKYKRYEGEFMSRDGVRYRAEIWQEAASAYTVKELRFPADAPLVIEWQATNKIDPVQSSSATLSVVSESDRQFVDLYTTVAGSIRLDVYRAGSLYWSGTMDTEIYEEPFAYRDGYLVTFTFADFAILDRVKYAKLSHNINMLNVESLIATALSEAKIVFTTIQYHIATNWGLGGSILNDAYQLEDNFFYEDDEPMTLREILDSTLQPFALRMIQKNGRIVVYDIHSACSLAASKIHWDSTDSVLSVDETFNNVELTFSPYMRNKLLDAGVSEKSLAGATEEYTWKVFWNSNVDGFKARLATAGDPEISVYGKAKYFELSPLYSGESSRGAAMVLDTRNTDGSYTSRCSVAFSTGVPFVSLVKRPFIHVKNSRDTDYLLRLKVDVLVDVRYNPFEEANTGNEEGNWKRFNERSNTGFLYFILNLQDANGNVRWHYHHPVMTSQPYFGWRPPWVLDWPFWQPGHGNWGDSYLSYYESSFDDRKKKSGFGGWKTNRPRLDSHELTSEIVRRNFSEGEYIPLPPESGWLDLRIGGGLRMFNWSKNQELMDMNTIHWFLLKNVRLELVGKYGEEIREDDVVYKAFVTNTAREKLEIVTKSGTMPVPHPTARGQLFRSFYLFAHDNFRRAGVTDRLERLLIGTIYSQYSGRKTKLSGTCRLINDFTVLEDEHESGKFLVVSEVQDLIREQSRIVMTQIVEDSFVGVSID